MNKKLISIISIVAIIIISTICYFTFFKADNLKTDYNKAIALANDKKDFAGAKEGLEKLQDKQSSEYNIKSDLKELDLVKTAFDSVESLDIDKVKSTIDKLDASDNTTFDKVIDELKSDVKKYDDAKSEIEKLDKNSTDYSSQLSAIRDKYKFNNANFNKILDNTINGNNSNKKETTSSSSNISDDSLVPTFGAGTQNMTYRQFRGSELYVRISNDYYNGQNLSNEQIKAALEWLESERLKGAQTFPPKGARVGSSYEEYKQLFSRATPITSGTAYVLPSSGANLRSDFSNSSQIIETLPKGTAVKVTGNGRNYSDEYWYSVEYNGKTGWIRSDLLGQ